MSRTLEKADVNPAPQTCHVKKNKAGYFCVSCNWRTDSQDSEQWSCCPACGADIVPEKRVP